MAPARRLRLVVADSSALIALASCRALLLLDDLAAQVAVPRAVLDEVLVEGKPQAQILQSYLEGRVMPVELSEYVIATGKLGRGELEAMALAKKTRADALLVDDARARKVARLNGIRVIGSLGILLMAKSQGIIDEIRPRIDELRRSDLYIHDSLLRRALSLAGENPE